VELTLRIDRKGRVLIPAEIRRLISLRDVVKAQVEGEKLILEPMRNPIEDLTALVVDKSGDVEKDIAAFKGAAEKALRGLAREHHDD